MIKQDPVIGPYIVPPIEVVVSQKIRHLSSVVGCLENEINLSTQVYLGSVHQVWWVSLILLKKIKGVSPILFHGKKGKGRGGHLFCTW